jgi:hypothetical protein
MQAVVARLLIPAKHLRLEVDMVIKAAGQMPFETLIQNNGLKTTRVKSSSGKIARQISKEYLLVVMQ